MRASRGRQSERLTACGVLHTLHLAEHLSLVQRAEVSLCRGGQGAGYRSPRTGKLQPLSPDHGVPVLDRSRQRLHALLEDL